jgi:hypothetical protein
MVKSISQGPEHCIWCSLMSVGSIPIDTDFQWYKLITPTSTACVNQQTIPKCSIEQVVLLVVLSLKHRTSPPCSSANFIRQISLSSREGRREMPSITCPVVSSELRNHWWETYILTPWSLRMTMPLVWPWRLQSWFLPVNWECVFAQRKCTCGSLCSHFLHGEQEMLLSLFATLFPS